MKLWRNELPPKQLGDTEPIFSSDVYDFKMAILEDYFSYVSSHIKESLSAQACQDEPGSFSSLRIATLLDCI